MSRPIDTVISKFISSEVKSIGQGKHQVKCPAHDDKQASLTITEKSDGTVLLHCHAGCSVDSVLSALGLSKSDLFPPKEVKYTISKTYDYTDVNGHLLYQVVRMEPKSFRQRRPDGQGGWIWKLDGVDRVLYRLPQLAESLAKNEQIWLVEGEKDVDNLTRIGLSATTNSGGAAKWQDSYADTLKGSNVTLIPDNDIPGRYHVFTYYRKLKSFCSVNIVEIPELKKKCDVSDWLSAGGNKKQLLNLPVLDPEEWVPTLKDYIIEQLKSGDMKKNEKKDAFAKLREVCSYLHVPCPSEEELGLQSDEQGQGNVFDSTEDLRALESKIEADINSVWSKETLGALAVLMKKEPGEYARIKQTLKGRINLNDLTRAVKAAGAAQSHLRIVSPDEAPANLEDILPEIPLKELRVPYDWTLNENGIYRMVGAGDNQQIVCACPVPVILTKRLRNLDSGKEKVELSWYRDRKWHYVTGDRSTVFNRTSIIQLSDNGLPVSSETSKWLVGFLDALEKENLTTLPVEKSVNHFGWAGKQFIPGFPGDVSLDIDVNSLAIAAGYRESGSLPEWVACLQAVRRYPLARFIISASFAAPLLNVVGQRIFFLYNWATTGSGKTAATYAGLSVWGDPETLKGSFNATKVGLERQAELYSDLPLVLDEKQVAGDKQNFIESIVYMLSLGKGKARGSKNGGLRPFSQWRTIVIATGEEPITNQGSKGGIETRVMEIYGRPIGDERAAQDVYSWSKDQHGTAGPEFVRKLVQNLEEVKEDYALIKGYLENHNAGKSMTHLAAIATVLLADFYSSMWIFGLDKDTAFDQMQTLGEYIIGKLQDSASIDDGTRAYDYFWGWLSENYRYFKDDEKQSYGFFKTGVVCVLPHVFDKYMKEGGFNGARILRDWSEADYIEVDERKGEGKKRFKKRVWDLRIKKMVDMVVIKLPSETSEQGEIDWNDIATEVDSVDS